ncbi:MAG TPA: tRNA 2-thiouridine(34) synthase MnmA [Chloroflexi bacterium]|nr:tRNA 2-thiouridine(34) synthase MnmA [Chloroflexota bacterium]
MPRVVIAMSGGVDSSVASALLKEQGYEVIGMMLRLWSEPGSEAYNRCCTPDDMALARRIAAQLDIPFYAVDAKESFRETVVDYFISGYTQGITPNPCLICNRRIRWEFLLERALALGADYLATGHYARLRTADGGRRTAESGQRATGGGQIELLRGLDPHKDQSYVLHVLTQAKLAHAMFPLGDYTKPQVREMARKFDLPVAERADSQDLCFLGQGDYRDFLLRNAPEVANPGPIVTREGQQLGEHQGLAFYTIGQRKGLGIAAPQPLYVIQKDGENNALVVGTQAELGETELTTGPVNWIAGQAPPNPVKLGVKIRYKAREVSGVVTPREDGSVHIKFEEKLRDITPGQAAVFFDGEVCLGGGIIEVGRSE